MNVERFVKLMTGHFDNKEQFTEMKEAGKIFPYAQHVNTVYNDKIKNLKSLHQLYISSWLIRCNKSGERKSTIQTEPAV